MIAILIISIIVGLAIIAAATAVGNLFRRVERLEDQINLLRDGETEKFLLG